MQRQLARRGIRDERVLEAMRIWFDESAAIMPLGRQSATGLPETYPFGG